MFPRSRGEFGGKVQRTGGLAGIILRSTEEAVRGGYYGPCLQLPTEREA